MSTKVAQGSPLTRVVLLSAVAAQPACSPPGVGTVRERGRIAQPRMSRDGKGSRGKSRVGAGVGAIPPSGAGVSQPSNSASGKKNI